MNVTRHVDHCPRCGEPEDYTDEEHVREFVLPMIDPDGTTWTHWRPCLRNGDPILIRDSGLPDAVPGTVMGETEFLSTYGQK